MKIWKKKLEIVLKILDIFCNVLMICIWISVIKLSERLVKFFYIQLFSLIETDFYTSLCKFCNCILWTGNNDKQYILQNLTERIAVTNKHDDNKYLPIRIFSSGKNMHA